MLIHAARQEPLGRVMLEAAASGVPVVATDVGGTREIFPAGCGAALLVDGTRDEAELISGLSNHVRRILSDASLHAELSAAARRRAEAAFSATRAAERLIAHYRQAKPGHFGTGGPGGDEGHEWQRWLRCCAAASECRDFSRA